MNDATGNNEVNSQELIAAYRQTGKNRALARRCITLLILGVILVHIGLLWAIIRDFRYNRMPEFVAAMSTEMANISPKFIDDVRDMVNRLYPHYVSVFQKMFERDWPKIKEITLEEMRLLDAHAQKSFPEIEKGIVEVVLTSEETLQEELNKFVSPAEVEETAVAYGKALQKKYDTFLSITFREHVNVSKEIGGNLEKIIAMEPDITQPVDMQEALGILLELVGTELQKGL